MSFRLHFGHVTNQVFMMDIGPREVILFGTVSKVLAALYIRTANCYIFD